MNKKRGVLLLELVIALMLISFILPFCYHYFLQTQKNLYNLIQGYQKENEFQFICYYLKTDLKQLSSITSLSQDKIVGTDSEPKEISYFQEKYQLKYCVQRPGKQKSTTVMNSHIKITKLQFTQLRPRLLNLQFTTDLGPRDLTVYLSSIK